MKKLLILLPVILCMVVMFSILNFESFAEGINENKSIETPAMMTKETSTEASATILSETTNVESKTISGTVSLPNGLFAPIGGINIKISLVPVSIGTSKDIYITIPSGSNTVTYSMELLQSETQTYRLRYSLLTADTIYLSGNVYYSINGTTTNMYNATPIELSLGSQSGLNMTLLKNTIISGNVSLPNNEVAPTGGLFVKVVLYPINGGSPRDVIITIPEGSNSAPYLIAALPSETTQSYTLYYYLQTSNTIYSGYFAYYTINGMTTNPDEATPINISIGDQSGFDMTLLKNTVLSGRVILPNGEVAPAGGIIAQVSFVPSGGYVKTTVDVAIPEGSNSSNYSISFAPSTTTLNYYLYYELQTTGTIYASDYVYYSINGTTTNSSELTLIDISQGDQSRLDMTLLKSTIISGSISLPNGEVAPAGGISVKICLNPLNSGNTRSLFVTIPEGSNEISYAIGMTPVTITKNYSISYELQTTGTIYYRRGYYTTNGTIVDSSNAIRIDISQGDQSDLDMVLIKSTIISGSVSLPNDDVAPAGGLSIELYTHRMGSSSFYENEFSIIIPEGSNSITYSINFEPTTISTSFRIFYKIIKGSGTTYNTSYVYYNQNGVTTNNLDATPIDISQGDQSGINLTLIKCAVISGRVSLPNGEVAPVGGIKVEVGIATYKLDVIIPADSNSVPYTIVAQPIGNNMYDALYYSLKTSGTLYTSDRVYYTTSGMTTNYNNRKLIDISSGNLSGYDMTLLKNIVLSGKVSLPIGEFAPTGGIAVRVLITPLQPYGSSTSVTITIPAGSNSAPYSIIAFPCVYRMRYIVQTGATIYTTGEVYYTTGGITTDVSKATPIDCLLTDQSGINMILLKSTIINGTVSLPTDEVAPVGGIAVQVKVYPVSSGSSKSVSVTIPEGNNSAIYSIALHPSETVQNYRLCYYLQTSGTIYNTGYMYYTTGGLTTISNNATPIDIGLGDQSFHMIIRNLVPKVIANDIDNTIIGFDLQAMEFAISSDGGSTYSEYSSTLPNLGGSKTLKVRYKAEGQSPASAYTVLTFNTNYGDINTDGVINISDVIMAAEMAVGYSNYSSEQIARANVSSKTYTTVDISDVVLFIERVVGGTAPFPVELP